MRKLVPVLLLSVIALNGYTQDFKKFRFGLMGNGAIQWLQTDVKGVESAGIVFRAGYGLATEFALSEGRFSFGTGLMVNDLGGKLDLPNNAIDNTKTYFFPDFKTDSSNFVATERTYKLRYVDLPITLKMKTNEIGMLTYFGRFGVLPGIRVKGKADTQLESTENIEEYKSDYDVLKDSQLFKVGLLIGAGFEYNLSGNTSVLVGLDFHNGFTNILKKESTNLSSSIANTNSTTNTEKLSSPLEQSATSKYIALTVGILF